jgi:hypothetical protein
VTNVRFADSDDIAEIVRGRQDHARRESAFLEIPLFAQESDAKFVAALMSSPASCVIVAEHPHIGIIGFYGGFVAEHYFSERSSPLMPPYSWRPAYRGGSAFVRMAMLFEHWARERGAVEVRTRNQHRSQPGQGTQDV